MPIQKADAAISKPNNLLSQLLGKVDLSTIQKFESLLKSSGSDGQSSSKNNSSLLNNVSDSSGLSELAADPDQWHSVMGQTYGYDSDSQEQSESENLRQDILTATTSGDWSNTGIDIEMVESDYLDGKPAAFVGGDTQSLDDDQILVNRDLVNGDTGDASEANPELTSAVTEELFHAFERLIHSGQNGDTQLMNGNTAQFAQHDQGQFLDEGALGSALLAQYNNGETPVLSDDMLSDPTIVDDDSGVLSNGDTVEFADFVMTDSLGGMINDMDNGQINDWLASSEEGYADKEEDYLIIYNSGEDHTTTDVSTLLERNTINGTRSVTEGVQDYIGWAMQHDEDIMAAMVTWLEGQTTDTLNGYDNGQLNGEEADKKFNVDIWKYAPAEQLLNVHNTREATDAVQDALTWQINNGGTAEINTALDDIGRANFIDDFDLDQMDDEFSTEFKEVLGPRPRSHDAISPLDVGSLEQHEKYQPRLIIDNGAQPYTAVDNDGNWNAGLEASGTSKNSGASSTDKATVIARTADSAEAGLPDNITAIQYSYYFPKDQGLYELEDGEFGHRHDWEDVIVFVDNDTEEVVGAGYSFHGDYIFLDDPPVGGDDNNQVQARYAYHTYTDYDGAKFTHSFGPPTEGTADTNFSDHHTLASYGLLSDDAKDTLNNGEAAITNGFDSFGSAVTPMRDDNINDKVSEAYNSPYTNWAAVDVAEDGSVL